MAVYSMSPYGFYAYPRYARQGERKLLDDLDGKNLTLRSLVEASLKGLKGQFLTVDPNNEDRAYVVSQLSTYSNFILVHLGVARRGLVGNLHQETGAKIPIGARDWNETNIRAMFVFPPGSSQGYWLCERVHGVPIVAYLSQKLKTEVQEKLNNSVTLHIEPVAEWGALEEWLETAPIRELTFDAPRFDSGHQSIDVDGFKGEVRISIKPKAGGTLKRFMKDSRPDPKAVFGLLSHADMIKKSSAKSMMKDGWEAKISYGTPNGKQRSFDVVADAEAPTLVYSVGTDEIDTPGLNDFLQACLTFIEDVQSSHSEVAQVKLEIENALSAPKN